LPRHGRHAVTKAFVIVTRGVLALAIVLAGVISVLSYLAGVSAQETKCAGRAWVEGYHNGIMEFLGLPLGSAFIVVIVGILAFGKSERLRRELELYDLPVIEFASIKVTLGESGVYSALLAALVMLGMMTGTSTTRYNVIVNYCLPVTALI
jgi:hypothetical protein